MVYIMVTTAGQMPGQINSVTLNIMWGMRVLGSKCVIYLTILCETMRITDNINITVIIE